MKIFIIISAFIIASFFANDIRADIYSWTDENGVKHYSNVPPENVEDPTVEFDEYEYDEREDKQRFQMEEQEWKALIQEVEAEDKKDKAEARRKAEEAKQNEPPSDEELIAREQERLENKIEEMEQMPLDYFGSQKNKRVRIGYYRYRQEALNQNPQKYMSNPKGFEGNVKFPKKK